MTDLTPAAIPNEVASLPTDQLLTAFELSSTHRRDEFIIREAVRRAAEAETALDAEHARALEAETGRVHQREMKLEWQARAERLAEARDNWHASHHAERQARLDAEARVRDLEQQIKTTIREDGVVVSRQAARIRNLEAVAEAARAVFTVERYPGEGWYYRADKAQALVAALAVLEEPLSDEAISEAKAIIADPARDAPEDVQQEYRKSQESIVEARNRGVLEEPPA